MMNREWGRMDGNIGVARSPGGRARISRFPLIPARYEGGIKNTAESQNENVICRVGRASFPNPSQIQLMNMISG